MEVNYFHMFSLVSFYSIYIVYIALSVFIGKMNAYLYAGTYVTYNMALPSYIVAMPMELLLFLYIPSLSLSPPAPSPNPLSISENRIDGITERNRNTNVDTVPDGLHTKCVYAITSNSTLSSGLFSFILFYSILFDFFLSIRASLGAQLPA